MKVPTFKITAKGLESYAEMFDVPLAKGEAERFAGPLSGSFSGVADLWDVDVTGCEPFTIFAVDRVGK